MWLDDVLLLQRRHQEIQLQDRLLQQYEETEQQQDLQAVIILELAEEVRIHQQLDHLLVAGVLAQVRDHLQVAEALAEAVEAQVVLQEEDADKNLKKIKSFIKSLF